MKQRKFSGSSHGQGRTAHRGNDCLPQPGHICDFRTAYSGRMVDGTEFVSGEMKNMKTFAQTVRAGSGLDEPRVSEVLRRLHEEAKHDLFLLPQLIPVFLQCELPRRRGKPFR